MGSLSNSVKKIKENGKRKKKEQNGKKKEYITCARNTLHIKYNTFDDQLYVLAHSYCTRDTTGID
jgi:hypothetical protein